MTEREAIEKLEHKSKLICLDCIHPSMVGWCENYCQLPEAFKMAISALEKQIPKKPRHIDKNATFDGNWKKVCPACGRVLMERITTPEESYPRIYNHSPHCICGQAIDWEEES